MNKKLVLTGRRKKYFYGEYFLFDLWHDYYIAPLRPPAICADGIRSVFDLPDSVDEIEVEIREAKYPRHKRYLTVFYNHRERLSVVNDDSKMHYLTQSFRFLLHGHGIKPNKFYDIAIWYYG